MKKLWPLLALGIGAFLLLALFTLPAKAVLSFFQPQGVTIGGVSGTLWNGRAQAVRSGALHVGSVEWKLDILRLFTGKLGADVKVTRTDGFAQGSIAAAPGGRITLRGFNASLPVSALPPNVVRGGWTGTLNLKLGQLTLENSWPVAATGTVEVTDLVGPANRPAALGNYKVVFPAEGAGTADALTGALTDTGGPLAVNGTVQLNKNQSYLVSGLIATRPGAPRDMTRTLEILGEPDTEGRRQFAIEGSM
jgi:general secretion pathway protein N